MDLTNDFLARKMRPNETAHFALSNEDALAIGIYLVGSGFWVGLANIVGLALFFRFPRALLTPSAVPEIGILLSDLCVGGLHPFSGSSALANRWLWGPGGCQLYSYAGFLFGNFQIAIVNLVALDRYILVCKPAWGNRIRTFSNYFRLLLVAFLFSFISCSLPLAGLPTSGYGMMATKIACTINYMTPSPNFPVYIAVLLLLFYLIPYPAGIFWTNRTLNRLSHVDAPTIHFASKQSYWGTIMGCMSVTAIGFSVYAVCCLWAVLGNPMTIPVWLVPIPPLAAKIPGILNPFFYIYANPLHWACVKRLFGFTSTEQAKLIRLAEEENEADENRRQQIKERIRTFDDQAFIAVPTAAKAYKK